MLYGKVLFTRTQCNFNKAKPLSFDEVALSCLFRPWELSAVTIIMSIIHGIMVSTRLGKFSKNMFCHFDIGGVWDTRLQTDS